MSEKVAYHKKIVLNHRKCKLKPKSHYKVGSYQKIRDKCYWRSEKRVGMQTHKLLSKQYGGATQKQKYNYHLNQKSHSGYIFEGNEIRILKRYLLSHVHWSICNSQHMHSNIYFTYSRILASRKEKSPVICNIKDEFEGQCTYWNKPDTYRQINMIFVCKI